MQQLRDAQPHKTYLGIDPGKAGGLALVRTNGKVTAFEMPETERELRHLFITRIVPERIDFCILERVHAIQHTRDQLGNISHLVSTGAMFTFGRGVGVIVGLLLAFDIPFEEMDPKVWQAAMGIAPRLRKSKKPALLLPAPEPETQSQWKNRLRATAQELFPGLPKLTSGQADALLMATVAKRIQGGFR